MPSCASLKLEASPLPGCHWSLGPALSSELFGLRRFATLYCLLNYSTTLGAYLLATRLVRTPRRLSCSPPLGLQASAGAVWCLIWCRWQATRGSPRRLGCTTVPKGRYCYMLAGSPPNICKNKTIGVA